MKCPLLKKPCIKHECEWYTHLVGKNPQTGQPIDEYACSIKWLPILLVEATQQTKQAGAAVESLRNKVVEGQENINKRLEHNVD